MMTVKIEAFSRIYFADFKSQFNFISFIDSWLSNSMDGVNLNTLILLPPLAGSFAYCTFVSFLEAVVSVYNIMRRYRLRRRGNADEEPDEEPVAHSRETDRTVQPAPEVPDLELVPRRKCCCACRLPEKKKCCGCCAFGMPLVLSALVVVVLDLAEAFLAL